MNNVTFNARSNKWWALLPAILAVCAVLVVAVHAAEIPALTGRVVDNANLLDASAEQALSSELESFEKKSSDQIVVATIESLDGESIESFSNRLFRAWQLGQAGENNGVLLLVARDDRKMRIEVGYGLEGALTDLHSSLIIQDMVPYFRNGDYAGGIAQAVDGIEKVLEGQGAELEARAKRNQQDNPESIDVVAGLFLLLWFTLFFGSIAMAILPRVFGEQIAPGRYRWLGMTFNYSSGGRRRRDSGWTTGGWTGGGGWSSGGGGWSGGGGFSGGGGSSGGGGASGGW
ncbi:MAG: YgcG family protein [Rhizobiaceae bacterium]|nr:YgcG family protein [Rhizobiaceae bacterium]